MSDGPQLFIDKNSWHFRYFCFIRKFWGLKPVERTSLCPYCQTMFWFSLVAFILSPLVVLGWVLLKALRISYKVMDWMGFERVIDSIDCNFLGKWLEVSDTSMMDAPGPTTLVTVFIASLAIGIPTGIYVMVMTALVFVRGHWGDVLQEFYATCVHIGTAIFYVFYFIGYCLHWTWYGIKWLGSLLAWFFTLGSFWKAAAYWFAVGLGASILACLVCYFFYALSQTDLGKRMWNFIIFRLNGYGEARKRAKARQEAIRAQREAEAPRGPGRIKRSLKWLKTKIFGEEGEFSDKAGKKVGQVLTTFGVFWEWIKGLKRNACPLIEFVEPVGSKPKAEAPSTEQNGRLDDQGCG